MLKEPQCRFLSLGILSVKYLLNLNVHVPTKSVLGD